MKATVLIDNIPSGDLTPEWGLSIYIEYAGGTILLDTGASDRFAQNADRLHADLQKVDAGVLSHAHYDHADGLAAFFSRNDRAKFFLRAGSGENCYARKWLFFRRYIGIRKGTLDRYADRIAFARGNQVILPGATLVPHSGENLEAIGRRGNLYVLKDGRLRPDGFAHEQSLVIETGKGLVVFNSCSHAGADRVIREAQSAFPDKPIYAMIGGFHLFTTPLHEVRALARRIEDTGVQKIYTGHCTGQAAFDALKETLGDRLEQLRTGLVMAFPD